MKREPDAMRWQTETRTKFARFGLTGHTCGEDIPPGRWVPATCAEYGSRQIPADVVLSSFTNMEESDRGAPGIFTEWGTREGIPSWASFRYPSGGTCWHLRYLIDGDHVCQATS